MAHLRQTRAKIYIGDKSVDVEPTRRTVAKRARVYFDLTREADVDLSVDEEVKNSHHINLTADVAATEPYRIKLTAAVAVREPDCVDLTKEEGSPSSLASAPRIVSSPKILC